MVVTLKVRARFEFSPSSPGFSDEPGLFLTRFVWSAPNPLPSIVVLLIEGAAGKGGSDAKGIRQSIPTSHSRTGRSVRHTSAEAPRSHPPALTGALDPRDHCRRGVRKALTAPRRTFPGLR
jgi:hypothetical protein